MVPLGGEGAEVGLPLVSRHVTVEEAVTVEEVQKDVFVRFVHRPLSHYVNGLIEAGLVLREMREPAPPPGFIAKAGEYEHEVVRATPRLLLLVADKADTGSEAT